jgi:hypothetical protein
MVSVHGSRPLLYAVPLDRARPSIGSSFREASSTEPSKPRLLDRVRGALRARHYSRRTEDTYVAWLRRYILFHDKRHPAEMRAPEITRLLSALAVEDNVAASTQNQALSALLFLYREVLELDLPWPDGVVFRGQARQVAETATKYLLPTVFEFKLFVEAGGLMSYGTDVADLYRRAALYVDRILKGTKPSDLPIEQPTKFELVINLKTAKALGLTVRPSTLARADKIIE